MMHHRVFKVVDRTLCDLMQLDDAHAIEKIFGGKTVDLGGDFLQILPIIFKGRQEDIVNASLPRLHESLATCYDSSSSYQHVSHGNQF